MIEFFRFNEDGNKHAQRLMRRAIELDPKFGPPYARLAYAAPLSMIYFDAEPTVEAFDESVAYARKAVGLSCAKDAWPHIALGKVHLLQCDYESALAESQIAVQLNPNLGIDLHGSSRRRHCAIRDSNPY
jgi:tetratricopeptide (TPR) repeat protein